MIDWPTHFRSVIQELGEPAVWVHGTGTGASTGTVTGIFRTPYNPIVLGGLQVDATDPVFIALSSDVPGCARGDTFTLRSRTYTVQTPKPDDVPGVTVAELRG